MPTKYFDIDGYAVNVFHSGPSTLPGVPPATSRGKRLLFLHGAGSNGGVWSRQLDHFSKRHSPVAFDWPGHGRSSGTEALASIGAYRESTSKVLDALAIDRAVIVGTSMGGLVALDLALSAPERVEALVLVSVGPKISLPAEMTETWRLVMTGRAPQPFNTTGYGDDPAFEILREGWEHQVRTDPRVRYFDLVAATAADYRPRLGEIRRPTLVVAGAKDPLTTSADAALLASGIAGARRVEIAGGGHFLYREKPAELHAAIDEFLDAV